jgi:ABC-2 type transport system permease protein
MHLRSAMQYKTSFALNAVGQFMTSFSVFIGIYFMFRRFGSVSGYTFEEVLICYAAVLFSFTAAECFFRGFDAFPSVISNGEFDRAMVRPRPVMLQVLCSRIEFARIGRFLQAAVILVYAIPKSGVVWTPVKVVTLFLMCAGGTALFLAALGAVTAFGRQPATKVAHASTSTDSSTAAAATQTYDDGGSSYDDGSSSYDNGGSSSYAPAPIPLPGSLGVL